jgi:hypothetical protein
MNKCKDLIIKENCIIKGSLSINDSVNINYSLVANGNTNVDNIIANSLSVNTLITNNIINSTLSVPELHSNNINISGTISLSNDATINSLNCNNATINGNLSIATNLSVLNNSTIYNLYAQTMSTGIIYTKGLINTINRSSLISNSDASPLTISAIDSGAVFGITKTNGVITIVLPVPQAGIRYKFLFLVAPPNNIITFSYNSINTGYFSGNYINGTNVINNFILDRTTIIFSASANIGDWIEFEGIDSTHYVVNAVCLSNVISFT